MRVLIHQNWPIFSNISQQGFFSSDKATYAHLDLLTVKYTGCGLMQLKKSFMLQRWSHLPTNNIAQVPWLPGIQKEPYPHMASYKNNPQWEPVGEENIWMAPSAESKAPLVFFVGVEITLI